LAKVRAKKINKIHNLNKETRLFKIRKKMKRIVISNKKKSKSRKRIRKKRRRKMKKKLIKKY